MHVVFQDGNTGNIVYRRGRLSALGIEENQNTTLLIYPNPTADILQINGLNKQENYRLLSLRGKELQVGEITKSKPIIEINSLPKGTYVLVINNKNYTFEKI